MYYNIVTTISEEDKSQTSEEGVKGIISAIV